MNFKRGTMLLVQGGPFNGAVVRYLRKNTKGNKIAVQFVYSYTHPDKSVTPANMEHTFDNTQMFIKSAKRPKLVKKSGSRLILCRCPEEENGCGLKIRVTANWLRGDAKPRCFNPACPSWLPDINTKPYGRGYGQELVVEWGERGDGVQHPVSAECAQAGCEVCRMKLSRGNA